MDVQADLVEADAVQARPVPAAARRAGRSLYLVMLALTGWLQWQRRGGR